MRGGGNVSTQNHVEDVADSREDEPDAAHHGSGRAAASPARFGATVVRAPA